MTLRGLHLHVDAASGAAGDMLLGALIDLGVPVEVIGDALDAIGAGHQRLAITRVVKHGISATDVKVDTAGELPGVGKHVHVKPPVIPPSAPKLPLGMNVRDLAEDLEESTQQGQAPTVHTEQTMSLSISDIEKLVERTSEPVAHQHRHTLRRRSDRMLAMRTTIARPPTEVETANAEPEPPEIEHVHEHVHEDHGERRQVHAHGSHPQLHLHEPAPSHEHSHAHSHSHSHEHAHYHYADIRKRIEDAALPDGTRRRALDIFDRIARAEAKIHGTSFADVAFHEVGAIDSVVDVVGTAAALDWLSPVSVTCSSVAMGHGTIHCSHGVLPVPAPAALEVLREAGGVMADGGLPRELCTPTGAAILASTVTQWSAATAGRPVAIGWGAGDFDLPDRPNVLRVTAMAPQAIDADAVWQVDANVDDMSPELCAPALEAVFEAGAVDAWWTPITMKKGRPALTLSALVPGDKRGAVIAAILRETTTIGVRYSVRERSVLARSHVDVDTRYGTIPIKVARDGDAVVNAAPEYEACVTAARAHGVAVKVVYAAALAAYDRTNG